MKLIDYLQTIEDPWNAYVVCINVNCQAFREAKEGKFSPDIVEGFTFFRCNPQMLLANSTALKLIKDLDITKSVEKQEKILENEVARFIYLYVDHDERTYENVKTKMGELLN